MEAATHLATSVARCASVTRIVAASKSFSVAAPTVFNKLPKAVRNCDTASNFGIKLKTLLFDRAYKCWGHSQPPRLWIVDQTDTLACAKLYLYCIVLYCGQRSADVSESSYAELSGSADGVDMLIQGQFVVDDYPKILHRGLERNIAVSSLHRNAIDLL